jgi:trans-aconitate methyltransferase
LERRTIRKVIDVGAYDGDTAKYFPQRFPLATVHCVARLDDVVST